MYIWWGPDLLCFYNDAYRRFIGAERHPESLGRPAREVWDEIWDIIGPQITHVMSGLGATWRENDLVPITRHGQREDVYWTYSYSPIDDQTAAHGVGGVLVVCTETTPQVLANRQLEAETDRLRRMFDQAPGFMALLSGPDHVLQSINAAYLQLVGHRDVVGKAVREALPEVEGQGFFELLDKVYRSGEAYVGRAVPVELQRSPGAAAERRFCDFVYQPLTGLNGEVTGIFVEGSDVTERAQAEAALRESEERFGAIANSVDQMIWSTRPDGFHDYYNERWYEFTGVPVGSTDGDEWNRMFHPEDRERAWGVWRHSLETGDPYHIEYRLLHHSGGYRWVLGRAQCVRDAAGEITRWFGTCTDIQEIVEARELIASSQEQLASVLEQVPVGVGMFDREGRFTLENRQLRQTLGDMIPSRDVTDGRQWQGYDLAGHPIEPVDYPGARALRGEDASVPIDFRRTDNNGEQWLRVWAVPLQGEGGKGGIIVAQDVSDELRVQRDLRASEEFNRRVLASSADCIKVLSLDGRLEFMSQGGMCVMEVDDFAAIKGACWPDFWQGEEHGKALAALEEAKGGGTGRFEGFATTMKGNPRWWDVSVTPINGTDGKPEKLLSVSRDVTAHRKSEERLRELNETLEERVSERTNELAESQRRFQGIFNSAFQFMALLTPDGMVVEVNQTALAWSQIQPSDIVGKPFWLAAPMRDNPPLQEAISAGIERAAVGETVRAEHVMRGAGEVRATVDFSVKPVLGERGEPAFLVAEGRDISSLKEAQEALRQSQKMEAMGQLTGGVAHDFNNLLTPIVGSLDLLQRKGLGTDREQRLIDGAMQSAERAKTLVQRLLAFARRQPLQTQAVDICGLIEGMADLIASTSGPRVKVQVDVAEDLPAAKADANQVEMAILNLAVNARDAMPDGGTLTISAKPVNFAEGERSRLKAGEYVRLTVADTGTGMDDVTLARAVEPFFSTKGIGRGTGLGLSMVHGLASQLGGDLTIATKPGLGTSVVLHLPASSDAVVEQQQARVSDGKSAAGTVLLVDDEELVRTSTAHMLAELGYVVVEAASGEEALRLIDRGDPLDVLVTDHLMPGLTGIQLADEVRRRRPDVPVLVVSGYSDVEDVAPGLPRLIKPFRQADLASKLRELASEEHS
jgi:PAS domain S-box-containing protein